MNGVAESTRSEILRLPGQVRGQAGERFRVSTGELDAQVLLIHGFFLCQYDAPRRDSELLVAV